MRRNGRSATRAAASAGVMCGNTASSLSGAVLASTIVTGAPTWACAGAASPRTSTAAATQTGEARWCFMI